MFLISATSNLLVPAISSQYTYGSNANLASPDMASTSTRFSTSFVLLLFLPLLFVSSSAQKKLEPAPAPSPSPPCDVKSVCVTTPFPDICRQSTSLLPPHATTDLSSVIHGMLGVSIRSARVASRQVKDAAGFVVGTSAAGCGKSMNGAVEVLERAKREVNSLPRPGSGEYDRRVVGVRTLVNRAVANSDACLKVLRGVPGGIGPDKAMGSVAQTLRLSSNLLVFVNQLQGTAVKH